MAGRQHAIGQLGLLLLATGSSLIAAPAACTWTIGSPLAYDDSYITKHLDDRYPYLKLANDTREYLGPRDYFNFSHLHEPTRAQLERVNLEQRLYEEIKSMEITSSIATMDQWHYTDERTQLELDGAGHEQHCLSGLNFLAQEARRADQDSEHLFEAGYQNQHTLRVLDSWGRPPSETYFGNSYWAGSYRGCRLLGRLASKYAAPTSAADAEPGGRQDEPSSTAGYRYCWAKLRAKSWPERDEMVPPTSIRVGVCLPASCNTKLANENRALILDIMQFNFAPMHRARFNRILDVYCLPKQPANSRLSVRIFCALIGSWILLLLLLSVFASFAGREKLPGPIYDLTIQQSYRKFASDDDQPAPARGQHHQQARQEHSSRGREAPAAARAMVDLRPVGVARFVSTLLVCLGHCFATFGWVSKASSIHLIEMRRPVFSLVTPLLKSNDIFWLLSGLLTAVTLLNKFHRQQLLRPATYFGIMVARYLRLAGLQVLLLSFAKSAYLWLGEGPFWDYGTYKYSLQGQCQRSSWWRVLLFPILLSAHDGNNYKHECSPVTWHIVADMKLSLFVPLLVYLLSGARRWPIAGALLLLSMLAQHKDLSSQRVIYFEQFFKYNQMTAINMLSMSFGETGYYNTLHRLFPLTVGLIVGVCLREQRTRQWPAWMRGWPFRAVCAYQLYDWFAHWLGQRRYLESGEMPADEHQMKWILLLKPRLDCLMLALIVARLTSDLAPQLMSQTRSLYKLAKLSYCVLLIHPMVISLLVNADESSRMDSFGSELVRLIVCCVTLSYLISFPLHILFEAPLASLTSLLFRRRRTIPRDAAAAAAAIKTDGPAMVSQPTKEDGKRD